MMDEVIETKGIGAVVMSSGKISESRAALARKVCERHDVRLLKMEIRFEASVTVRDDSGAEMKKVVAGS
jgi:hypothetical protein